MTQVDPSACVAFLQEVPDVGDVVVRHRVVGIGPVHPLAEPSRLLGLKLGEAQDPLAARPREGFESHRLDLPLAVEAEGALHLHLDPQALAIKAVLVAQLVAGHGEVALVGVLVGAAPGVVDAHRVVGGDRAVEKRPLRLAAVLLAQLLEGLGPLPKLQDGPLLGREIDLRIYLVERHVRTSEGSCGKRLS